MKRSRGSKWCSWEDVQCTITSQGPTARNPGNMHPLKQPIRWQKMTEQCIIMIAMTVESNTLMWILSWGSKKNVHPDKRNEGQNPLPRHHRSLSYLVLDSLSFPSGLFFLYAYSY